MTCVVLILGAVLAAPAMELHTSVSMDWMRWHVLMTVTGAGEEGRSLRPALRAEGAHVVSVQPAGTTNEDGAPSLFMIVLERESGAVSATLTAGLEGVSGTMARCDLPVGYDLSTNTWELCHGGDSSFAPADAEWIPVKLPRLWEAIGVTWVRTRVNVPETLRGVPLHLRLAAVDDSDTTYLNGQRIGSTQGWDKPRDYVLPEACVRWGQENELAIAVENVNAGGGLYRTPIEVVAGSGQTALSKSTRLPLQPETERAPGNPLGQSTPLRRMEVRNGVLQYEDGGEVALWGVNYYPQSWTEYESLKSRGIDHRKAIDDDFEDFSAMGIDLLRIHVFDREISDGQGNLVRNEHLDLLDYLVAKCNANGIYLMLTPIAWWPSVGERPGSFSSETPKQAMCLWPEAWPAQANYFRQFLSHKNPHTGRKLFEEPCLALLELFNEADYWNFEAIRDREPGSVYGHDTKLNLRGLDGVRAAWERFAPSAEWRTPEVFAFFRRNQLRRYIDTMIGAIREVGARQPVAFFRTWWSNLPDVSQGIADSQCSAITIGNYPGGLPATPLNDGKNLLSETKEWELERVFETKARLVYEFDAAGALNSAYLYPAMARQFRHLGVQTACQFQYDPRALAHLNPDWPQHYLNYRHTPEKAVSFMIAGEVFRRLPRGAHFEPGVEEQVFAPGACSFAKNVSLLCAEDCYMQSRPTDWRPLPVPPSPARIVSVGACPYFEYGGTGIVQLTFQGDQAELRIAPDVERLCTALTGSDEKPLSRLHEAEHAFRLTVAGWEHPRVTRSQNAEWTSVSVASGGFMARAGVYHLERQAWDYLPPRCN